MIRREMRVGASGILNLNKPAGITSFGAVSRVRRLTGERHVGHAGTLDPFATGVLPICLGQATRLTEYLHTFTKEYAAGIELGAATDTYDRDGTVTRRGCADRVVLNDIQDALRSFVGYIDQIPPAYSAIKVRGRQSYDLARAGIPVAHQPRQVRIDSIDLVAFVPPLLEVVVRCSKGTYIRSIANDLGEKLGCGAYLKTLIRLAYGPFKLNHAHSLEDVESACAAGNQTDLLHPLDFPLKDWARLDVDENMAARIIHGEDIPSDNPITAGGQLMSAYDSFGKFLAIMKFMPETGLWHPEKVFIP
jgi:tRNA pseudouridine55 synthase